MSSKHRKKRNFINLDSPDVSPKVYVTFTVVYILAIIAVVMFL